MVVCGEGCDLHSGVEDVTIPLKCDIASLGDTALYSRGTDTLTFTHCLGMSVKAGTSYCSLLFALYIAHEF